MVLLVFVVTRLAVGYVADHPDVYPAGSADPTTDLANYVVWGNQMQDFGRQPYRDFSVEYPPGSLGLANLPYWITHQHFRVAFIIQSVVLDALGLVAMWRLAKRRGSWWGVVAWLLLLPLLGPVAYARLDLAVAACLAWAFERVEARRWTAGGAWLGLGIAIKLTPGLLLPGVALAAPKRWRPVAAAVAVVALAVLPFLGDLRALYDDVIGYHLHRGVHAESLWGSAALLARVLTGSAVEVVPAFGAYDIVSSFEDGLRILSNIAAVGVLLDVVLAATTRVRRGDGAHLVLALGGGLMLLTAVGRVFSPQYLVWLVAPMAAGLAIAPRALRWSAALLAVSIALAHLVFPVLFYDYLDVRGWAVAVGFARNLALLGAGLLATQVAWRYTSSGLPATEEHQAVEVGQRDLLVGPDRHEGHEGDDRCGADDDRDKATEPPA